MDIDAFVAAHTGEWQRLRQLVSQRSLSGLEADELVYLYQRTATHLSVVRTRLPDPVLIGQLSTLVARGRAAAGGGPAPAWRDFSRFFTITFPVNIYYARRWIFGVAALFLLVAFVIMFRLARSAEARAEVATPDEIRQLVEHDFANYYSENPAQSFAAQVWINNALVSAGVLVLGITLIGAAYILYLNAVNIGVAGGLMIGTGHGAEFFGLLSPHGILELTAVFTAAGAGLRLGWTLVEPGLLPRAQALAARGRSTINIALGLIVVLAISGIIEAFVTPSPLPTWARVGIGVIAEAAFLGYVYFFGRRAAQTGETGDLDMSLREDVAPVS